MTQTVGLVSLVCRTSSQGSREMMVLLNGMFIAGLKSVQISNFVTLTVHKTGAGWYLNVLNH